MDSDPKEKVACMRLPDGCLLRLRPFEELTPEEQEQVIPGERIFLNTEYFESIGGEVVTVTVTQSK